uniref:Uncharacterized protein n=1 Tax=Lepeophtheirus salmonis TaxID=72036 RepID=A0A0K2V9H0_LEPSM
MFRSIPIPISITDQNILESLKGSSYDGKKSPKGSGTLKDQIQNQRQKVRQGRERNILSQSFTLVKSEENIFKAGDQKWRSEIKDLNESFSKLPPIPLKKKVKSSGQSFMVE